MSAYRLVIVREDGDPVFFYPGSQGERDLKADLLKKVEAKGVGLARTTAHVLNDVGSALDELIYELKAEVIPR